MNKTTISYKTNNILIDELSTQDNIEIIKEASFISKIFSKKKYADVYFHSGSLDENSIDNILNAKITIANCFASMNEIIAKTKISHEKVKVIYPSINIEYKKTKEVKDRLCAELEINASDKIILFTAKNFKFSGIKEFLDICTSISYEKFKIIVTGDKKQITALQFQIPKYQKIQDKIIVLIDYKNIDDLFLASDIFILPTYNKSFATNIIKAMFCKCAVFVSLDNDAKEIVDVFASMDSPTDSSMGFKLDAVLNGKDDLKLIKKENRRIAIECNLENNLEKVNTIIGAISI
ncbi:MAG: glycosyltransferase [Aliarcobacter sp.]|jgi:glycosyltransferase involved in cell wall biosynthesis|nr:glycosyltransferase [Aliarcobacter sp.]